LKQENIITAQVHARLREMIINKELPIGAKIRQSEMAELLRTSRTPVISALHKLESEGLVDNVPNAGFYVHRLSIKELLDLFALREALDTLIVNDLIFTVTDEELSHLESFFRAFSPGDIDEIEYRKADREFHSMLVDLCRNELARKVNESFQVLNRSYLAGLLRPANETLLEHRTILDALKRRNPQDANSAMNQHIAKTTRIIRDLVTSLLSLGIDPKTIPVDEIDLEKRPLTLYRAS
jgi:DNA-binding GntR family transcriptional regulator